MLFGGCSAASQLETVVVCECVCVVVSLCVYLVCAKVNCVSVCVCVSVVAVSVSGEVVTKKELRVGDGFKRKRDVGESEREQKTC